MKVKILILSIAIGLFMISCTSNNEVEETKAKLKSKKTELSQLKLEIRELQEKIAETDESLTERGVAVFTQEVQATHFEHFFVANGSFEASNYAFISPETSGQIKDILVQEGDYVKKGQLVAKLNSAVIENNIREIETALSLAKIVYEKQKELWDKNIGSELDYLKAETDKKRLENQLKTLHSQQQMSQLKSPINGVVDDIAAKVGEMAAPGQMMMQIIDLSEFILNVEVSESYLPYLKKGDAALIYLVAYGNKTIDATISRIANTINPENRSFKVQLKVKNNESIIKPNMLAEVRFKDYDHPNALTVPSIIIKNDFKGSYLFVAKKVNDQMISKKIYVTTGRSKDGETMVENGLHPGDLIITEGYNQVVEGGLISIK